MHKIISAPKWLPIVFFFLTILVAIVQYLWWFRVAPPFTNEYNTDAYITGIILLAIYGLTAIFWKYTKNIGLKKFLLFASVFWLLANVAYINWFKPFLEDSVNCKGTTYFLTYHQDYWFSSWDYEQITKWRGTSYKQIYWDYRLPERNMICDEKEEKMKAFLGSFLGLSDSINVFDTESVTYYELLDDKRLEGDTLSNLYYNLYSYISSDNGDSVQKYLLTICEPDKPETCQYIPVDHSSRPIDNEYGSLEYLGTKELYILFDGKIHSAYGNEAQRFDSLAFEKIYYMAGYFRDNTYIYILYRCTPYKDCFFYIPFSYTTKKPQNVKLEIDPPYIATTHKLSVYIGDELVFIYKVIYDNDKCKDGCPESRCLVVGCTIPSQQVK